MGVVVVVVVVVHLLLLLSADCTRINIMTIIILSCKLKHNAPSKNCQYLHCKIISELF